MSTVQTHAQTTSVKDKGTKAFFIAEFARLYPKWALGDVEGGYRGTQAQRNMKFRAEVSNNGVEHCGLGRIENAAGHYNAAKLAYEAAHPGSTTAKGLGRPEGKNNGGRKKVVKAEVATAAAVGAAVLGLSWNGQQPAQDAANAWLQSIEDAKAAQRIEAAEANAEEVPVPQSAEQPAAEVTDVGAKPSKKGNKKA